MKVVNLYGGPGSGKSTFASGLHYELKLLGYDAEIVPEFAKDLVWEERDQTLTDQGYIFNKQNHRLHRLNENGKLDFVIVDSPLLLSLFYGQNEPASFHQYVKDTYSKYCNVNIFLERKKKYNPNGRLQTEDQAKEIDTAIRSLLCKHVGEENFYCFPGERSSMDGMLALILNT